MVHLFRRFRRDSLAITYMLNSNDMRKTIAQHSLYRPIEETQTIAMTYVPEANELNSNKIKVDLAEALPLPHSDAPEETTS